MKRFLFFLTFVTALLAFSVSAFAGDIPEVALSEDSAKVFIGTVDSSTIGVKEPLSSLAVVKTAKVTPTIAIKGEILTGVSENYENCDFGSLIPRENIEYLFCHIDGESLYAYEIEAMDDEHIILKGSREFAMIKRLEDYLNEGAFARAEKERSTLGTQISFVEYLYKNPSFSSSSVDKVTLRYQGEIYEVEKDKFFEVAENIMITNVKNEIIRDERAKPHPKDSYDSILFVELCSEDGNLIYFGAVTRYGEVDRYGMAMSRLMAKDYEMKSEDLEKLYSLISSDVQTDEKPASSDVSDSSKLYIIAAVIVAAIIVSSILIIFRKKRK